MDAPNVIQFSLPPRPLLSGPELSPMPANANPEPASGAALSALARFEFEAGKGNDGTKILMVEWDLTASSADMSPSNRAWEVSWDGKTNYLPASDMAMGTNKRLYFLLPPDATVPSTVTITHPGGVVLTTKPLPAIFPPGLITGNSEVGPRGVLHTIWAKKRLSELQAEVDAEMKTNSESVGLEMALQERQWIIDHFGVAPKVDSDPDAAFANRSHFPTPISPRSPVGGRLGEKLKGLKLATSAADLIAGSAGHDVQLASISFSPASGDMAVSSFSNFARQATCTPNLESSVSLDGVLSNAAFSPTSQEHDQEEDLFALPMSPRSPEMKRSPFSLV
ncbi:hypothetical protein CCHL11_02901 [Colletotrichum chlorophyti]|uniref:Uncharacterized protein n=1 Tax=Colletotrichum chlorophyti TaxID=708187 RepID=A0A1Q8S138_9PEZI|nr:hypothetical protein CCHL11_02901 [Colletotrichum chlorophyti]